jgi:nicotinic acid phosphoribosyltransferase
VHVDKTGRIVYTATARFLEADVIRYLAALSFDGYAVDVYGSATPGQFEMRIRGNQ